MYKVRKIEHQKVDKFHDVYLVAKTNKLIYPTP